MKFSSLRRLYHQGSLNPNSEIELVGDFFHYIVNVLRLKAGYDLRLFNESGEYNGHIIQLLKKSCTIKITKKIRDYFSLPYLCVAVPVIKNDRMNELFCALTQLGATDFVPITTDRSQEREINYERINRILIESAEQSERMSIPKLHNKASLKAFLSNSQADLIVYANEHENQPNILSCEIKENIAILVGPEGGFSDSELNALSEDTRSYSTGLGPLVLRSEIAMVTLASAIQMRRLDRKSVV
jgi:16S rRNA (uracil1498-N3)-methyltransferase